MPHNNFEERAAIQLFESGDFLVSAKIFKQLATKNGDDARLYYMAAVAFMEGGDAIQANDITGRLVSKWSLKDLPEQLIVVHLRTLRRLKEHRDAVEFIESASRGRPRGFSEQVAREITLTIREFSDVGTRIETLENIQKCNYLIRLELGRQLYRSGQNKAAERYLSALNSSEKNSHDFKLLYSSVLTSLGKFNESISCLTPLNSGINPDILINLARNQQYLGDFDGAKSSLQDALSLDSQNRTAGFNLGLVYYATGDYKEGMRYLRIRNGESFGLNPVDNIGTGSAVLDQGFGEQLLFLTMLDSLGRCHIKHFYGTHDRAMSFMARHFPQFNFYFHKPSPEHCGGIPTLSEVIFSLLASGEEAISKVVAAHHPNVEVPLLGPGQTVGLSWFSTSPNYGKLKSLKAREVTQFLARAKKAGVRVLSLHAHDEIAQVPEYRGLGTKLSGLALEWPLKTSALTGPLDQLADVIAGCDAIVSVPNTTAHLASALGKRVSVLQRAFSGSHWYWTNDAIYSRFYPHTTINRFFDEFPAAIDLYFPEG